MHDYLIRLVGRTRAEGAGGRQLLAVGAGSRRGGWLNYADHSTLPLTEGELANSVCG